MTLFAAPAVATGIAGFEADLQGFSTYTGNGVLSIGPDGATEGVSALQLQTPNGGFVGVQSFGINQADLIAAATAGETLFVDISLATPNTTDFATLRAGVNNDNGFEESSDIAVPIDGSLVTVGFDLGAITSIDGDETFAGLILAVNGKVDSDLTFRIDNIRTVPEPATLALTAVLIGATIGGRRRVRLA